MLFFFGILTSFLSFSHFYEGAGKSQETPRNQKCEGKVNINFCVQFFFLKNCKGFAR